jgi:hypothetical protein
MDLLLPPPPKSSPSPFGLVSVCGLLTELEDVGRVVALAGYGHEARRLPFLCRSLYFDEELLVATRTAVYGGLQRTRLMSAARAGDVRRVQVMLRPRGAEREVDAVDAEGLSALHHACAAGQGGSALLLLDAGADTDVLDLRGNWCPLRYATAMGHADVVRLLLGAGAVLQDVQHSGEEPLHLACEDGRVDIVRLLLDAGAELDVSDDQNSPYILAVQQGHAAVVLLLLDHGQNVDGRRENGDIYFTALSVAAWHGQAAMVELLLSKGADVDAQDHRGRTVLHDAALCPVSASFARLFLSHGADPEARADEQQTPLEWAREVLGRAQAEVHPDPQRVQELEDLVGILEAPREGVAGAGAGEDDDA